MIVYGRFVVRSRSRAVDKPDKLNSWVITCRHLNDLKAAKKKDGMDEVREGGSYIYVVKATSLALPFRKIWISRS